jgi:hypothetical protein
MQPTFDAVEVERWFIRRGVPHFIEDYSAAQDMPACSR